MLYILMFHVFMLLFLILFFSSNTGQIRYGSADFDSDRRFVVAAFAFVRFGQRDRKSFATGSRSIHGRYRRISGM